MFLPPVFMPGSPENEQFKKDTINILNQLGEMLKEALKEARRAALNPNCEGCPPCVPPAGSMRFVRHTSGNPHDNAMPHTHIEIMTQRSFNAAAEPCKCEWKHFANLYFPW